MKNFIYKLLIRDKLRKVYEVAMLRQSVVANGGIRKWQIDRFNEIWRDARMRVPFYGEWQRKYGLPDVISDLRELVAWPILTKKDLRNLDQFRRLNGACPTSQIMTGGSTGEPVRLPSWGDKTTGISQIIGRGWYGIKPWDRTFLLWGHEHLYGTGFRRKIKALQRRVKDWLANRKRVSAYDLSSEAMRQAYKVFARFKPKFIIGFSPAILSFVRHNKDMARRVDSVRVILCTAGPLTPEEKCEIEDFFNGVVCMEYGSVECGVMAYTRPEDGKYNVFWDTHLLQAQKQPDGEYRNLVTRLTDCYVPLIRYDIGDYLELEDENEENVGSVLEIKSVKGRPSEMLNFKCGVSLFGALIGDCVKQVSEVISSQIAVDENSDELEIRVTATNALKGDQIALIKDRFRSTVEKADKLAVRVVQVEKLFTTVGGKTPRVVRLREI